MFTIDAAVDTAVKTAKQAISYVQDKEIKKEFEALVDAQASYAKTVYNTNLELSKVFVANFGKVDAKAFDLSKYFAVSK